jgi:hypothetical protein
VWERRDEKRRGERGNERGKGGGRGVSLPKRKVVVFS